ncbi:MAG: glycosyltransferase family 4 protein [Candidatus Omnitrophica bacterium]|nr:glycosyltransferase family 4 protein [Candidatus Omnitrophota bacterium]
MNVLLVNKFHHYRAGVEGVYFKTAELLKAHGHNVVFFSMQHPENLSCVDLNAPHNILSQIRIAGRILYYMKARNNLAELLNRYPIDIAHLHDICYHISPSILHELKKRNIPVVMTLHDFKMVCTSYYMFAGGRVCVACSDGKYYMPIKKRCVKDSLAKSAIASLEMYLHHKILDIYNNIDIFISPSLFLKKKLGEAGFRKKIVHLYNFFDIKNEKGIDAGEIAGKGGRNTIIYIGRLSYEKGLYTLLDAAKLLLNKGDKIKVNIIGDGPLMSELQIKVRAEQIDNVSFLGYMKHEDLYKEIRNCIAVILPSECYENNPLSVIEAFALNKPVIGSRIGGIPELVKDNERGLTFLPGDADDLSLKIKYMVDNPEKAVEMGRNARLFVEKELNSEKHYQGLMSIYKSSIKLIRGNA